MAELEFENFDLWVEPAPGGDHQARVMASPAGDTVRPEKVINPFTAEEVTEFLAAAGLAETDSKHVDERQNLIRSFGGRLFDAVFHGKIDTLYRISLDRTRTSGQGLRLRLRICPDLASLPWEFLWDATLGLHPALQQMTPLVRYVGAEAPSDPLAVRPPLRVLVMVARPNGLDALDAESEWQDINTALAEQVKAGRVVVGRVDGGTRTALDECLEEADRAGRGYHVLHYIGHGGYEVGAGEGALEFEGDDGGVSPVGNSDLGGLLHDHPDLRLVVLNSCEGARGNAVDQYAGTAQSLVQKGIQAVIAMQFQVDDEVAVRFADALYEQLARFSAVDAAMSTARRRIAEMKSVEWATPVLFLRGPNGRLFDLDSTAPNSGITRRPTGGTLTAGEFLQEPQLMGTLGNDSETVLSVAISRQGDYLASAERAALRVWSRDRDAEAGWSDEQTLTNGSSFYQPLELLFSPDGRGLACATENGETHMFSTPGTPLLGNAWDVIGKGPHPGQKWVVGSMTMAFNRQGSLFVTAGGRRGAELWAFGNPCRRIARLKHDNSTVAAVAMGPDGRSATVGVYGRINIWDPKGKRIFSKTYSTAGGFRGDEPPNIGGWSAFAADFDPQGGRLVTAASGNPGLAMCQDLGRSRILYPLWETGSHGQRTGVNVVRYSPDGRVVATLAGSPGNRYGDTCRLWKSEDGAPSAKLTHDDGVTDVRFSPEGKFVATASKDMTVRIWDLRGTELVRLPCGRPVWSIAWNPDGTELACGLDRGGTDLWRVRPPRPGS